jgi:1,5-anhydro-D-fructose reductase (1,5-anhydro-D-mannitol-forming)
LVGASTSAARTLRAIRDQHPLPDPDPRRAITHSRIIGIFSHNEHRARLFAVDHAVPQPYVNLADLLAHPDIHCVYISNHPRHHAQTVMAALAAGKHVLCEPPLALTLDDAQAAAHTALSRGLVLGVNYLRRADPAVRALRERLADGTIGELLGGRISNAIALRPALQTWRLRSGGGGVLFDRTLHSVDLIRYVLRDEAAAVLAHSTQHILGSEVDEDVVGYVVLRRSGLVFQLHDSFLVPHTPTAIEIHGSAGTLVAQHCLVDDYPSELHLTRQGQSRNLPLFAADFDHHVDHQAVQLFAAAVRGQGMPLATGTDGVQSLAVALAAQESIRRGRQVSLTSGSAPRTLVDRSLE